jgi:hypothetical protein
MIEKVVFDTLNVLASMIVFAIVSWKLIAQPQKFTWIERVGMGLTAAGCILTIGPVTFKPSPYDDWSGVLMRVGMALYFIGRMTRHQLNNYLALRDARRRLRLRGKL